MGRRQSRSLRTFSRLLSLLVLALVAQLGLADSALAHNTLVASEPAAEATLDAPPSNLLLRFTKPAPLATASAEVIDAAGNRTKIDGLSHGPGGDTEIVVPLPKLASGAVTLRWRLVGPDGHPLTGRIPFTIARGSAAAPVPDTPPAPVEVTPTAPPEVAPAATVEAAPTAPLLEDPPQVAGSVRWALRWISYVAMLVLGGILAAAAWILPSCWWNPQVRATALVCVMAIGALGAAQLLILAGDIAGTSPVSASWSSLSLAIGTTAGKAFALRVVVAVALGVVLAREELADDVRWLASGGLLAVLLATWAFAGHSGSMRWAVIGVPLDVAHHAAAALWLGGLVVISRLALVNAPADEVIEPVQRFAQLAPIAVGVLVLTGIIQSIRLTGMPDLTLASTHTRLLVAKLLALGLMLKVADINRRRVARRFSDVSQFRPRSTRVLRQAMIVEFSLGLIIVAITAAMVVSPPPVADVATTTPGSHTSTLTPFSPISSTQESDPEGALNR